MRIKKITLFVFLLCSLNGYTKDPQLTNIQLEDSSKYQHADRYVFAPSSLGLTKGDLRYSTYFYVAHELQYGFTDYFSLGIGTSIIGNPAYAMASFHHKLNRRSAIMLGDLFLTPTYTDVFAFAGNLCYGMYTYGSNSKNISMGVGAWTSLDNEETFNRTSPAINISGSLNMSPKWYFVTENYAFQITKKKSALFF